MFNKLSGEIQIKSAGEDMTFTAYGNVKNVVDHANDVAVDGCYSESIKRHKKNGTMPKLFWSHNPFELPVGKINTLEEDSKGLLFDGKISKTTMGKDVYELAKDGAITEFSIGYRVIQEKWNIDQKYNELLEIDIKEISFVNFACNEHSTLQDIKSEIGDGKMPTKRELESFLRSSGLSRKQAEIIASQYNPVVEQKLDLSFMKDLALFKD